jgi:uncharacterized membrane protein YccC
LSVRQHWSAFTRSIVAEVREFAWESPRRHRAVTTGLATALACLFAWLLHLDYPMWSAMSAFTVMQASARATALKAVLRIIGTVAGAAAASLLLGYIAGSKPLMPIALFAGVAYPLYRSFISPFPYAWLLAAITIGIVLIAAMDNPGIGLHFAAFRAAEIATGSLAAYVAALLLLPAALDAKTDRALARAAAVPRPIARRTALEAGSGITLVVLLYDWLDLPGFSSAAVSLLRVVDPNPELGHQRALLRLIGCTVGAGTGLVLVAASIQSMLVMLLATFLVCSLFGYFFSGPPASAYAGMQAGFAFIITFAPQLSPTMTFEPAVDRLAGIVVALAVFWLVDALFTAGSAAATPR